MLNVSHLDHRIRLDALIDRRWIWWVMAREKKSRDQLENDTKRTTSAGLFQALELYLKALLLQKHSVQTLTDKLGHNIKRLVQEAEALGLVVAG
jgi:HEPN domain-containing protein